MEKPLSVIDVRCIIKETRKYGTVQHEDGRWVYVHVDGSGINDTQLFNRDEIVIYYENLITIKK